MHGEHSHSGLFIPYIPYVIHDAVSLPECTQHPDGMKIDPVFIIPIDLGLFFESA